MKKSFNISGKWKDITLFLKCYAIKQEFTVIFIRQGKNVNFLV